MNSGRVCGHVCASLTASCSRVSSQVVTALEECQRAALTTIVVGVDGTAVAVFGLSDVVKPEAAAVVSRLAAMNIDVWMLTGDNAASANAVAAAVGIPMHRVHAQVLPAGKCRVVKQLQAAGGVVAMVGDGINDAPALAQVPSVG